MIITSVCYYCNGTGDWRGLAGKKHSDFKSKENECYHCKGTGRFSEEYTNNCKYCGKPCSGYACKSCFRDFEEQEEGGDDEE